MVRNHISTAISCLIYEFMEVSKSTYMDLLKIALVALGVLLSCLTVYLFERPKLKTNDETKPKHTFLLYLLVVVTTTLILLKQFY